MIKVKTSNAIVIDRNNIYRYIHTHYMNDITVIMDDITWKNQEQGIN